MKCPICKKEVKLGDAHVPFCSERCQLLDLGKWASEEYVISTPINPLTKNPQSEDELE